MNASRHFYAIAGIATILTASGLATSRGHSVALLPNPQPVTITNGSSNPVPTAAQGTTQVGGTVAVSTLPAVQVSSLPAVQLATGSTISLTGTPTVHVDDNETVKVGGTVHVDDNQTLKVGGDVTAHVPAGETIGVNNTCSNPIPVSVDCPRTPVSAQGVIHLTDGTFFSSAHLYDVPAGQRLVIQTVFGQANLQPGQKVPEANIGMYPVPFTDRGTIAATEEWSDATSQVDYYFPSGASIDVEGHRSDDLASVLSSSGSADI